MKRYIRSSEDDGWAFDTNYVYRVAGGDRSFKTDDPQRAIIKWFQYQADSPQDCAIFVKTRADGVELLEAATPQLVTELITTYRCPYKKEYMLDSIERNLANRCSGVIESEYGDQVDPFSFG